MSDRGPASRAAHMHRRALGRELHVLLLKKGILQMPFCLSLLPFKMENRNSKLWYFSLMWFSVVIIVNKY